MEGDDGESEDAATDCQAVEGEDGESQVVAARSSPAVANHEEEEADWNDAS